MADSDIKAIDLNSYDKISPRARKKAYRAEINAIKEHYRPKKYRRQDKHKDWKTDWKGYVECTYPWDGSSILEMIVYRLEILRACLRHYGHHEGSEAEVEEMGEVIELGRKIIEDNYSEGAQEFSREHCAHIINIYLGKKCTDENKIGELVKWKYDNFDDYFGDKDINVWCRAKGYDRKAVSTSYSGRWDDMKNHDIWLELLQSATTQREEDKKKFFNILADKLETWWD